MSKKGFTTVELLIVMSILVMLVSVSLPLSSNFQTKSALNESSSLVVQMLRTANIRAMSAIDNANHGVYFEINPTSFDRVILYEGDSYATRNLDYDRIQNIDNALYFLNSNFNEINGSVDINFSKDNGLPNNIGELTLLHLTNGQKNIQVNSQGAVIRY